VEKLLTIDDLSEILQVKKATIYSWCHMKKLPHIKVGGSTRFREKDIMQWLDDRVNAARNN
jgi:excisionase family DNA binding protein